MNRTLTLIGVALLCGSFLAHAQAPAPGRDSKDGDRKQQMRERMKAAHEACKDKPDRRACMSEQMCAKSEDPAKCRARAQERGQKHGQHGAGRMDERQAMHEACTGKRGGELQKCLDDQRKARKPQHGDKPKP